MYLTRSLSRLAPKRAPSPSSSLALTSLSPRSLWTAATCSHPDLATSLSRCFPDPTSNSTTTSTPPTKDNSVTIILASRSYPGSDLLALPSKIPKHISRSSTVLSAVVDRVPTPSGHGVSTLSLIPTALSSPSSPPSSVLACAPFYLSGPESRRKRLKEKSVGKWARSQDIEERSLDTADAWNAFKSISIGRNQVQVPEVTLPAVVVMEGEGSLEQHQQQQQGHGQGQEQDIFMISDLEVHQFLEALDQANPGASKIGLVASSTPFITGRPVTMFYDGRLVQDGVLGVSVIRRGRKVDAAAAGGENAKRTAVGYPSMATLGPAMQITRCRGNIILELDESNATRLLLDRLKATTLTKDKEYFLATGPPFETSSSSEESNLDMAKATVYKITGGDPAKGNMAVDTVHDLEVGQWVQFIHHDKVQDHGHYDSSSSSKSEESLRFTTSDPNNTIEEQPLEQAANGNSKVESIFGGSSENGFIVGLPHEGTWVCTVTDSVLTHA